MAGVHLPPSRSRSPPRQRDHRHDHCHHRISIDTSTLLQASPSNPPFPYKETPPTLLLESPEPILDYLIYIFCT